MNLFKVFFFSFQDAKGHVNKLGVLWVHKLAPGEKSIISTFRKLNKYLKSSHNNH